MKHSIPKSFDRAVQRVRDSVDEEYFVHLLIGVGGSTIVTFLATVFLLSLFDVSDKHAVFCVESASVSVSNESVSNLTMARWNVGILAENPTKHTHMYDGVDVDLSLINFDHIVRATTGAFQLRKKSDILLNATGVARLSFLDETRELNVDIKLVIPVDDELEYRATSKNRRFDFSTDVIYYGSMVPSSKKCCSGALVKSLRCYNYD